MDNNFLLPFKVNSTITEFLTFYTYRKFKTWPGALASMLVIGTVIAYTVARFSVMLSKISLIINVV